MTGQKNRFKTHEKLWNIDDKQLKTPKHDALVLWLMDDENLKKVLKFPLDYYYEPIGHKGILLDHYGFHIESEVPLNSSPTFIGGYADLIVTPTYSKDGKRAVSGYNSYLIEIKPYIDSFGGVLRQIKSYKQFTRNWHNSVIFCLFTLDDRFDKQFESQKIRVIHPPKDFDLYEYMNEMGLV